MSEDERLFSQAMREVEPLRGRKGTAPRSPRRVRSDRGAGRRKTARFTIERAGERIEGLAPGADRRRLLALARGELPVDLELDLHRLTAEEARGAVRDALARAAAADQRCLLIVHGRGRRSAGGPVLKEALPGWLAEPPHAAHVLAFASAPPRLGGPGATLVLLRRQRRR